MNNALVTTGLLPLTRLSTEIFEIQPRKNGLPWDLTGGTVVLRLVDPNGAQTDINATISGRVAQAGWTVSTPEGTWRRVWDVTDSVGVRQVSRAVVFSVTDPLATP